MNQTEPDAAQAPAEATPEEAVQTGLPGEEAAKYKDLALRARAELDNFRKRAAREKEDSVRFANARLLGDLLPVLDSFDLGLQAARAAGADGAVVDGFEMVRRRLDDFLREHGAEVVHAEGAVFDPAAHEAVGHEPSAEAPEGQVLRQLRPGYRLRERLLRPASVVVSKGPQCP